MTDIKVVDVTCFVLFRIAAIKNKLKKMCVCVCVFVCVCVCVCVGVCGWG